MAACTVLWIAVPRLITGSGGLVGMSYEAASWMNMYVDCQPSCAYTESVYVHNINAANVKVSGYRRVSNCRRT